MREMATAAGLVHFSSGDRNPRVLYEALLFGLPLFVSRVPPRPRAGPRGRAPPQAPVHALRGPPVPALCLPRRRERDGRRAHRDVPRRARINRRFDTSGPTVDVLELGRIAVDAADFWTDRWLPARSRSAAEALASNQSKARTLTFG